eukprot:scaffold2102_cov411-Prasinococcus_capsulatus_cf.AAC.1
MKTVPVYGYYSEEMEDHMYGLSYEAPIGYTTKGYAFSLFSDGDFEGSTPIYSSTRVDSAGDPMGNDLTDSLLGVTPMAGASIIRPKHNRTSLSPEVPLE